MNFFLRKSIQVIQFHLREDERFRYIHAMCGWIAIVGTNDIA